MKKYFKSVMVILYFMVFGCSAFSHSVEPVNTPTQSEIPSDTLAMTKQWTVTQTITESASPTPTRLPYTMMDIDDTKEDLASIFYREARNAEALSQAPYIQIYADWCPSCRALERSMKDERMMAAYRGTYIMLIDIDVWRDSLPAIGVYVTGVPAIYELTYEGKPTGRFITGAAWEENTPENMAPPLDEFFHPD